jgi:hypothetical protein
MVNSRRAIRSAMKSAMRLRHNDRLAHVLDGPDTTFRSELIEALHRA